MIFDLIIGCKFAEHSPALKRNYLPFIIILRTNFTFLTLKAHTVVVISLPVSLFLSLFAPFPWQLVCRAWVTPSELPLKGLFTQEAIDAPRHSFSMRGERTGSKVRTACQKELQAAFVSRTRPLQS